MKKHNKFLIFYNFNPLIFYFFTTLIFYLFNPLILYPSSDTSQIKDVMQMLEQGWQKKDITIIKKCFHKMSDKQKKLYETLFAQIDNIDVDIDIKLINIKKSFCNVNTELTKKIIFKNSNASPGIQKENINYILMKVNNKWGIIGTVYPDRKQEMIRVTDKNLPMINKKLQKIPEEYRKKVLKDYITVSEKYSRVYLTRSKNTFYFKVTLNTLENDKDKNNKVLWTVGKRYLPYVEFPKIILDKMEKERIYYLNIVSFNKEGKVVARQILKVKKEVRG